MSPVPLLQASDPSLYGSKAARLGAALRAGLPVPAGVALPVAMVEALAAAGAAADAHRLGQVLSAAGGRAAVRSSAVGEDSALASFAGQFTTELNITSVGSLDAAIRAVARSGQSPASELYRTRLGIAGPLRMAVIVQQLVSAEVAGVLFTRDPLTQQDTCLIEAAWGSGEVVVSGRVTPDSFRLDSQGRVCERRLGLKDVQVQPRPAGGMQELPVASGRARMPCLRDSELAELHQLARRCEALFGPSLDLEWALCQGKLFLLQCRPITR